MTDKPKAAAKPAESKTDTLDAKAWASSMGFSYELAQAIPGMGGPAGVFQQAIDGKWNLAGPVGQAKFTQAVQNLQWVKDNGTYMLAYAKAKASSTPEAWADQLRQAADQVKAQAVKAGAELDDNALKMMAESYMMYGWNEPSRQHLLDQALTGQLSWTDAGGQTHTYGQDFLNYGKGAAAVTVTTLKNLAAKNGVQYGDDYFQSAARAVSAGLGTLDDYANDIRNHAASANPALADKIKAGFDVQSLADPYMQRMADVLELDKSQIQLNDPTIRKALGAVDQKGQPTVTSLWDFERQLRQDPRWQKTDNAYKAYGDAAQSVLSMFGFR